MLFNRLPVIASINVISMLAYAAEFPSFDESFLNAYKSGVQTMVRAGSELSPRSKENNALKAYTEENERISKETDPSSIVPPTRRPIFTSLWSSLCTDSAYQSALRTFMDSKCDADDRQAFMKVAATRTAELLMPHGVNYDLTTSGNTPKGHTNFLRNNKDMKPEASEQMLAGVVVLYALGAQAKKIKDLKGLKTAVEEGKK